MRRASHTGYPASRNGKNTKPWPPLSILQPRQTNRRALKPMPAGAEREQQIYALGLSGGKPCVPVPLNLLEQKAKEILVPRAYDYVAGGAGGEDTMRDNREAFYRWRIV